MAAARTTRARCADRSETDGRKPPTAGRGRRVPAPRPSARSSSSRRRSPLKGRSRGAALAERLAAAGIPTEGQAMPHLLRPACSWRRRRGAGALSCAGAQAVRARAGVGGRGARRPSIRDAALGDPGRALSGRACAPATAEDLAGAGQACRPARPGQRSPRSSRTSLAAADPPPVFLLLRPLTSWSWKDRSFAAPPEHALPCRPRRRRPARDSPTVDGVAVGTWRLARRPGFEIDAFAALPPEHAACVEAEAGRRRALRGRGSPPRACAARRAGSRRWRR